jgi:DNA replicative helicase MCM subunit Mcm2 (Cdc46/Mcm family)
MKRNHSPGVALAAVLAAALCAFTPGMHAQNSQDANQQAQPQQTQPQQAQQQPDQQQQEEQQSKTYEGKVVKLQDGKFALVTGQTPQGQMTGHFLDDEGDAAKYEGKQVKVTGTLEAANNTIHVTKIEAA